MGTIVLLLLMTLINSATTTTTTKPKTILETSGFTTSIESNIESKVAPAVGADFVPKFTTETRSQFTPRKYGDATKIEFSNGISFDTKYLGKTGEPNLPEELKCEYRNNEVGYYIVQFAGPIYQTQKDWLTENGTTIHFYLPHYGFVCSMKDQQTVERIRANPSVNWVGVYQPAYKISASFDRVGEEHKVTILLFMDSEISAVLNDVKIVTKRTEFIISDNGINKIIQGVVSKKDINALARIKGIYWIEPYFQPKEYNSNVQWIVQSGTNGVRSIWAKGIQGEGEIVNSADSGILPTHNAHMSGSAAITTWGYYPTHNAIVAYDSGSPGMVFGDGTGDHGTHTVATLTGDDTTHGTNANDGVAKRSRVYFLDIGKGDQYVYPAADLNEMYDKPYNRYYPPTRAHVSTNSWGSSGTASVYDAHALNVDQFMWGHKDFVIFFANGNSEPVQPPATAKNLVSVGACQNGPAGYTQFASFSSWGPTQDGRLKPTVITPGENVISASTAPNNYQGMSGTSCSSPSAAGTGALVRQYLREGWYPTGKKTAADAFAFISASLVKAIIINSADPNITGFIVPDNNIGWGRIDLDSTLYFANEARKTLLVDNTSGILTGEQVDYHFDLPAGAANLKITLVWTDYPGNPTVIHQLVNDLDLSAHISADSFVGNQYAGGQSIQNPPGRDTLNVEECIRVNTPAQGDWRVSIEGRNVVCGPQPFSLVISYNAGSVSGFVSLDKPVYRANDFMTDTVRIRIEDANYGSAVAIDSVGVAIYGDLLETAPESVWCRELAESAYVFKGEIPLLFNKPVHGDGQVSVGQGDKITVTYTDENPSYTSMTWAGVDADYFTIANVHPENIGSTNTDICWATNENANSTVRYGTDPGNLNQIAALDTPYVLPHSVRLTGLSPKTTYYYDAESKDFYGNKVLDNNDGRHYTFTSKPAGAAVDILVALADGIDKSTPQGQPLPQLAERITTAVQQGGWSYNFWATSDHNGELPPRNEMKLYRAVFMPNEDEYPEFHRCQMDTIKLYEEGGGRIAFSSHDLLWYSWDFAGGSNPNCAYDSVWCKNYMQARYKFDLTAPTNHTFYGVAGDPITGDYTAGVTGTAHRTGAVGDTFTSIDPPNGWDTGVSAPIWRWQSVTGSQVGHRWESYYPHGTLGDGVWGGRKTRTILNAFSVTQMNLAVLPEILNKEFIWLIGHDHPDLAITSPLDDSTYTSSPISIAWDDTVYGGTVLDTTWIEYSPDGGTTWFTVAAGPGISSPYSWNVSALPPGAKYQVVVTINDKNVYPSLKGADATGNFAINIPGNDNTGPKVIPQSIVVGSNPMIVTPENLTMPIYAVASDSLSGLSNVSAAEYSLGSQPHSPGNGWSMNPLDGTFDAVQEPVTQVVHFLYGAGVTQICSLWVRARDGAAKGLNWGNALMRTFTSLDGYPIGISETGELIPYSYAFSNPLPNPMRSGVSMSYAIPKAKKVVLKVYNSLGQVVKTLVDSQRGPGVYNVYWNGQDDLNRKLSAGVYFCRFSTDEYIATKKMVIVR